MEFKRACTLDCFDLCTYIVKCEDNQIISPIVPDKEHPYTKGIMCLKGKQHLDRLNHKERLTTPLLKKNGVFHEINFFEAIELFASKLNFYKREYGSTSVLRYNESGDSSVMKNIPWQHFFNYFGGITTTEGGTCWSAGMEAQHCDFGQVISHDIDDILNAKSVILWGRNPSHTSIHLYNKIKEAKKNGIKIITIDPITTTTALESDYHFKIKAGNDDALAIGIIKTLIIDNKIDYEYINKYSKGSHEFFEYINRIDINEIYQRTGLNKNDIQQLSQVYYNKPCSTYIGYGMQKYKNGGNSVRCIDALCFISSNIGISGAGANYANRVYPLILDLDPFNSIEHSIQENSFYISDFAKHINSPDNTIKMAVVTTSNPMNQLPDIINFQNAFKSIDFKVTFDMFMTETALLSDLVIPCTNTLETEDLIYSSMNCPYLVYNPQVVKPKNDLMDEFNFIKAVSKLLNFEFPNISKEEYIISVIKPLIKYNINLETLKSNYVNINKDKIPYNKMIFYTPSRKYEFCSERANKWGNKSPKLIENNIDIQERIYPYRLITPHMKDSMFSQHIMDSDDISIIYISIELGNEKEINDGDLVNVVNEKGKIKSKVKIKGHDDVVYIYAGFHMKHGNPNVLTSSERTDLGGQICYNETYVDIIK